MVVIEMDIPTGYVVMNDRLREYVKSGAVPTLSRAEFYDRKVVFYLDYVSTSSLTNSCTVEGLFTRTFSVSVSVSVSIKFTLYG